MPHSLIILADDSDAWVKFIGIGVVAVIWLIGHAVAAANKLAKKPPNRPRPVGSPPVSTPRPPNIPQPPTLATIGRPGGPATSLTDARRLAQARAAQVRAAQLRQASAQRAAPISPQRPTSSPFKAPPPRVPSPPAPAARPAVAPPRPAAAATAAAVTVTRNAAAVPRPTILSAAGAPRPRMLPSLTPQYLRSRFILTEILRAPVALRQGEGN